MPTARSPCSATSMSMSSTSGALATCSSRCRPKCATTRPSWTASTATCRAGTCPSSSRTSLPTTSAWSAISSPSASRNCVIRAGRRRCKTASSSAARSRDATSTRSTRRSAACSSCSIRVEKFVSTPKLQSQGGIGDEPLEAGQLWALSPGGQDEHPGLFRLEVTEGPGSGVCVLNKPVPQAFQESIRCAEQNLYARSRQLVGDRDPRAHEFSAQLRGFDAAKSGAKTGVASLIALCSALLRKSVRGGLIVVGEVTLGGTIEPLHNAVSLAEIAVEKGARSLLLPVSCRPSCSICPMRWRPGWTSSSTRTRRMR